MIDMQNKLHTKYMKRSQIDNSDPFIAAQKKRLLALGVEHQLERLRFLSHTKDIPDPMHIIRLHPDYKPFPAR
jgi:hypothetical protein